MSKESYRKEKESARQYAIDWQEYISRHDLSYGELVQIQDKLYTVARKHGLVKEFKENGIL